MFGFGVGEWLLVGGIAVLLFGPSMFVKAAGGLGQGVAEFKKGLTEANGDKGEEKDQEEAQKPPAAAS